jgi:hypothetical protein
MFLAGGRRTASSWFVAAGVQDDWDRFYDCPISVGRTSARLASAMLGLENSRGHIKRGIRNTFGAKSPTRCSTKWIVPVFPKGITSVLDGWPGLERGTSETPEQPRALEFTRRLNGEVIHTGVFLRSAQSNPGHPAASPSNGAIPNDDPPFPLLKLSCRRFAGFRSAVTQSAGVTAIAVGRSTQSQAPRRIVEESASWGSPWDRFQVG